jgi:hypothetical protein
MFFEIRVVEGVRVAVLTAQTGEVVVTGPTAGLIQCLAAARVDADQRPCWRSLGDVLWHLGASSKRLVNRRGVRSLIRGLNRRLAECGSVALVETHRERGLRLREPLQERAWRRGSRPGRGG